MIHTLEATIDRPVSNGRAAVIDVNQALRHITINRFETDSQELFETLARHDSNAARVTELKKVVDIGAFVKNRVQSAMDTDFVNRRVGEMTAEFNRGLDAIKCNLLDTIASRFDPHQSDSYTHQVQQFFEKKKAEFAGEMQQSLAKLTTQQQAITGKIDESFNPELKSSHLSKLMTFVAEFQDTLRRDFDLNQVGSITNQLKALIYETLSEDGRLVKSLDRRFSFDNPNSPLSVLQNNLLKKLEDIKAELAATKSAAEAEKAALAKSTQKGVAFEDELQQLFEGFAQQRGDLVEHVANSSGDSGRSKKGDLLYRVMSLNKTIAIEAKNRQNSSTPDKLLKDLEEIKTNRQADYVIFVAFDEGQLHRQIGTFQEYPPDKIITHLGLWEIALKIAISRLTLEHAAIEGIDQAAVETEIKSIQSSLKSFRSLKTSANNIVREAEKIHEQAEKIKDEITQAASNLSDLLLQQKSE